MRTLPTILLSIAFLCAATKAQSDMLDYLSGLPALSDAQPRAAPRTVPLRPDPIGIFFQEIRDLAQTPDRARLRALFWPEATDEHVAASMDRVEGVLAGSPDAGPSLGLKELARLPEKSRAIWARRIATLTSYDASAVLLIIIDSHVVATLPLHLTEAGLKIVPLDRVSHGAPPP